MSPIAITKQKKKKKRQETNISYSLSQFHASYLTLLQGDYTLERRSTIFPDIFCKLLEIMQLLIILHGKMMKLLISFFGQLLYEHLFQLNDNQTVPEETSYSLMVDT